MQSLSYGYSIEIIKPCQEECSSITQLLVVYRKHKQSLWATLPAKFERRCIADVGKAGRRGYRVDAVADTTGILPACLAILDSTPIRQGRATSKIYMTYGLDEVPLDKIDLWPVADYSNFSCDRHYCRLLACYHPTGKIVGLLEYARSGNDTLTTMALGHREHLKDGVMNQLFHTAMTSLPAGSRFHYGQASQLALPIAMFFKGLGIGEYNVR